VRRNLLELEYAGEITKGFYGFGFVYRGNPAGKSSKTAAEYLSKNAAGYMASNAYGRGRHYVASRLTRETGITMRALRSVNWLYVRRKLIDAGELDDDWIPSYWTDDQRQSVLRVWDQVSARGSPEARIGALPKKTTVLIWIPTWGMQKRTLGDDEGQLSFQV
jgi:hypothetical protein